MRLILLLLLLFTLALPATTQEADPAYRVEKVITANYPVSLTFAPDGRLFYTEKATGNVRVVSAAGALQAAPVITLPVDNLVERGLLGIALDPRYTENGHIWVFRTAPGTARDFPANQIVRFTEADGVGRDPEVLLSVPITSGELHHNGGTLRFDGDGTLWASIGDNGDDANSQALDAPQGKLHRFSVTEAGLEAEPGNPFPDNSLVAYGFRNPFSFDFDPISGALFTVDNGPKCDDEINRVEPGGNYGWGPGYEGNCYGLEPVQVDDYVAPLVSFNPTLGMAGMTFYDGDLFPEWAGDLFFCTWNDGALRRLRLNSARDAAEELTILDLQGFSCRIDVTVGPDGALVFTDPAGIYRVVGR